MYGWAALLVKSKNRFPTTTPTRVSSPGFSDQRYSAPTLAASTRTPRPPKNCPIEIKVASERPRSQPLKEINVLSVLLAWVGLHRGTGQLQNSLLPGRRGLPGW